MNKKKFILILLLFTTMIFYSQTGYSAISGTVGIPDTVGECTSAQVETFKFTLTKFEVSYDNGSNWTTVWSGEKEMDFATAETQGKAGDFFVNQSFPLPEGQTTATITDMRVTIGQRMKVKGYVTYGGSTYRTVSGENQSSVVGSTGAEESTIYSSEYTEYQITDSGLSITITADETVTKKMTFDMTNALGLMETGAPAPYNYMIVLKAVTPDIE